MTDGPCSILERLKELQFECSPTDAFKVSYTVLDGIVFLERAGPDGRTLGLRLAPTDWKGTTREADKIVASALRRLESLCLTNSPIGDPIVLHVPVSTRDLRKNYADSYSHRQREQPEPSMGLGLRLKIHKLAKAAAAYQPLQDPTWTLPQTISWIAWRTTAALLRSSDTHRRGLQEPIIRRTRIPVDGGVKWEVVTSWELPDERPTKLNDLLMFEDYDRISNNQLPSFMSVDSALQSLRLALQQSRVVAYAISVSSDGRAIQIPGREWGYLNVRDDPRHGPVLTFGDRSDFEYRDIRLEAASIRVLWEVRTDKQSSAHYALRLRAEEWFASKKGEWETGSGPRLTRKQVERELFQLLGISSTVAREIWADKRPTEWEKRGRHSKLAPSE